MVAMLLVTLARRSGARAVAHPWLLSRSHEGRGVRMKSTTTITFNKTDGMPSVQLPEDFDDDHEDERAFRPREEPEPHFDSYLASRVRETKSSRQSLNHAIRQRLQEQHWEDARALMEKSVALGFPIAPETYHFALHRMLAADELNMAIDYLQNDVQFRQAAMYNLIFRYFSDHFHELPETPSLGPAELLAHMKRHALVPDASTFYYYTNYLLRHAGDRSAAEAFFDQHWMTYPCETAMIPLLMHLARVEADPERIEYWLEWMYHNEVPIGPMSYHALALALLRRNRINDVMILLARLRKTGERIRSRTIRETLAWFDLYRKGDEAVALFESLPSYNVAITTDLYLRLISILSRLKRDEEAKSYLFQLLDSRLPLRRFNIVFKIDSAALGMELIERLESRGSSVRPFVYTKTLDLFLEEQQFTEARDLLAHILQKEILPAHQAIPHLLCAMLKNAEGPEAVSQALEDIKPLEKGINEPVLLATIERYPVSASIEPLIFMLNDLVTKEIPVTNATYAAIFQQIVTRGVTSDIEEMWEVVNQHEVELTENQLLSLIKAMAGSQLPVPVGMADRFITYQLAFHRVPDAYSWSRTLTLSPAIVQNLFDELVRGKRRTNARELASRHPSIDRSLLDQVEEGPQEEALKKAVKRISPLRILRRGSSSKTLDKE